MCDFVGQLFYGFYFLYLVQCCFGVVVFKDFFDYVLFQCVIEFVQGIFSVMLFGDVGRDCDYGLWFVFVVDDVVDVVGDLECVVIRMQVVFFQCEGAVVGNVMFEQCYVYWYVIRMGDVGQGYLQYFGFGVVQYVVQCLVYVQVVFFQVQFGEVY